VSEAAGVVAVAVAVAVAEAAGVVGKEVVRVGVVAWAVSVAVEVVMAMVDAEEDDHRSGVGVLFGIHRALLWMMLMNWVLDPLLHL